MQSTAEIWRPIPGFEEYYAVSDQGRVKSFDRTILQRNGRIVNVAGRILKHDALKLGYHQVSLTVMGQVTRRRVHQLVMLAFVGPYPDGMEICHNNGDRSDNRLSNLRYDTHSNNQKDQAKHGTHHEAAKTHCIRGHEFTPENTRIELGKRVCVECVRVRSVDSYRRRKASGVVTAQLGGSCGKGHEFDRENTYIDPAGRRQCRTCRSDTMVRYRMRRSGGRADLSGSDGQGRIAS